MAVGAVRAILWHGSGRLCRNDGHRIALRVLTAILWPAAEMEMPGHDVGEDAVVGVVVEEILSQGGAAECILQDVEVAFPVRIAVWSLIFVGRGQNFPIFSFFPIISYICRNKASPYFLVWFKPLL